MLFYYSLFNDNSFFDVNSKFNKINEKKTNSNPASKSLLNNELKVKDFYNINFFNFSNNNNNQNSVNEKENKTNENNNDNNNDKNISNIKSNEIKSNKKEKKLASFGEIIKYVLPYLNTARPLLTYSLLLTVLSKTAVSMVKNQKIFN